MLVVTADHGDNHTPPHISRITVTDANGRRSSGCRFSSRRRGRSTATSATTPRRRSTCCRRSSTCVDAEVDWQFDGHSLFDGSAAAHRAEGVDRRRRGVRHRRTTAEEYPHGDDWTALAAVGANGDLVGRRVDDVAIGAPSDYRASLTQQDLLADLPTPDGEMPFVLVGRVAPPDGSTESRPSSSPP